MSFGVRDEFSLKGNAHLEGFGKKKAHVLNSNKSKRSMCVCMYMYIYMFFCSKEERI